MKKSILGLLLVASFVLLPHRAGAGAGVSFKLSDVASRSTIIVLGRVDSVRQIRKDDVVEGKWEATITIASVLKGEVESDHLTFEYRTYHYKQGSNHRWKIAPNDSMVFFLKEYDGGLYMTSIGTAAVFGSSGNLRHGQ